MDPGGSDGELLTTPISYRVCDHEINEIVDEAHTNMYELSVASAEEVRG